jgi:hypothetical protein
MQQVESAAAQTGAVGLDHRERCRYGNRGVERVAALGEHFLAGFARQRMGACDGALVRDRGFSGLRGLRSRDAGLDVGRRRRRYVIRYAPGVDRRRRNDKGAGQPNRGEKRVNNRSLAGEPQSLRCRFSSSSTMG